jgi:hypothetical protein
MPQLAARIQTRFPPAPSPAQWRRPPPTNAQTVSPSGRSVPARDAIQYDPNQELLSTNPWCSRSLLRRRAKSQHRLGSAGMLAAVPGSSRASPWPRCTEEAHRFGFGKSNPTELRIHAWEARPVGFRGGKAKPKDQSGLDPPGGLDRLASVATDATDALTCCFQRLRWNSHAGSRPFDLGFYRAPHTTYGFMLMVTPAPSGPVTMASDCHVDSLSGNDELRTTYWFAAALEADT